MTTRWGGWLPWNRRWQTETVSLAEAVEVPAERRWFSSGMQTCVWCGQEFPRESAPDGYGKYCTSECVTDAIRDRFLTGGDAA